MTIIGRLTKDPEHRTTTSGKEVTTFTVAVNKKGGEHAEADFFRVSAWGEMGNNCARYLAKGKKVAVTGSVSVSAYKDRDGNARGNLDVYANAVEFLSPKDEGRAEPEKKPETKPQDEDDLPF